MQKKTDNEKQRIDKEKFYIFSPAIGSIPSRLFIGKNRRRTRKKIILFKIIHICQLFLFSPIDNVGNMPYNITRNEK